MDLTVRDLADLLTVPEQTILRWIERDGLPAYRLHEQYRLNRVELQEWAATHQVKLPPELHATHDGEPAKLSEAIERGGIHRGISGTTREEVLRAIVALPGIPDGIDRERLYQLLITREALSSTGFGGGIAIPHPRNPLVLELADPVVLVCFLARPVEFGAIDGRPVRVLLPLLAPSVSSHLRMLSRLSYALHDRELRGHIDRASPAEAILGRLREIERALPTPSSSVERR